VILVPKKSTDGKPKYRYCVDFCALNPSDGYPLARFKKTTSTPAGCKYFSVLDCCSGFWQIKMCEKDKEKTAFTVPSGHYEFNRLSQGYSTGVPREIMIGKNEIHKYRFLNFARRSMLALSVMDSDRAARSAISLEVFQPRMAVRSRTVFIWLSSFSVFDAEIVEAVDN
jgi:hypothetical protein